MAKALGHLAAALMFTAIWPFLVGGQDPASAAGRFGWLLQVLGQVLAPGRDLATVLMVLVLLAAQCLAVVGLASLLRPLGHALLRRQAR
jgi:hypothetical protein